MGIQRPFVFAVILSVATAWGCGNAASDPDRRSNSERSEISNLGSEISEAKTGSPLQATSETINVNTAPIEELQRLPHIGASMAEKIIEHRQTYGPFKRPEELMQIQGISDIRFRRIRHLVRVE